MHVARNTELSRRQFLARLPAILAGGALAACGIAVDAPAAESQLATPPPRLLLPSPQPAGTVTPASVTPELEQFLALSAILTGFALAFARAVGEYGSVVFIAGNLPMKTEIAPLLIVIKLEQYDYLGATAIGAAMLVLSFALLLVINLLQAWGRNRMAGAHS